MWRRTFCYFIPIFARCRRGASALSCRVPSGSGWSLPLRIHERMVLAGRRIPALQFRKLVFLPSVTHPHEYPTTVQRFDGLQCWTRSPRSHGYGKRVAPTSSAQQRGRVHGRTQSGRSLAEGTQQYALTVTATAINHPKQVQIRL